jgi:hypothetical protein
LKPRGIQDERIETGNLGEDFPDPVQALQVFSAKKDSFGRKTLHVKLVLILAAFLAAVCFEREIQ